MTKNKKAKKQTTDALLEEHRHLRELMDRICATSDLVELLPELDELREALRDHFETEEAPGGFGEVVAKSAPHKGSAVDHLFAEHKDFLRDVQRLHDTVESCLAGPIAEVRSSASLLCKQLRKHEEKENELLADALYTDIGGG